MISTRAPQQLLSSFSSFKRFCSRREIPAFSSTVHHSKCRYISAVDDMVRRAGEVCLVRGFLVCTKAAMNNITSIEKKMFLIKVTPCSRVILAAAIEYSAYSFLGLFSLLFASSIAHTHLAHAFFSSSPASSGKVFYLPNSIFTGLRRLLSPFSRTFDLALSSSAKKSLLDYLCCKVRLAFLKLLFWLELSSCWSISSYLELRTIEQVNGLELG